MGFLGGAMFGLAVSMMTASVRTGSVLGQTHFTRSRRTYGAATGACAG